MEVLRMPQCPLAQQREPAAAASFEDIFKFNSKFRVLLVEDDLCTLRVVEQMLRQCSYDVVTSRNGKEALRRLHGNERIDLILTDALMPEVNGIDLAAEVLRVEKRRGTPVIVMSVEETPESILKALQAGACDYLIKPIRRNELATLWQHIWRFNRERGSEGRPPGDAGSDANPAADEDTPQPSTSSQRFAPSLSSPLARRSSVQSPINGDGSLGGDPTRLGLTSSRSCTEELGSLSSLTRIAVEQSVLQTSDSQAQQQQQLLMVSQEGSQGLASSEMCPSRPQSEKTSFLSESLRSNGSVNGLPPALQEIAAIGELRERLRSSDGATASGINGALDHSREHSAFTAVAPQKNQWAAHSRGSQAPPSSGHQMLGNGCLMRRSSELLTVPQPENIPVARGETAGNQTLPGQSHLSCDTYRPSISEHTTKLDTPGGGGYMGRPDIVLNGSTRNPAPAPESVLNVLVAMQHYLGTQMGEQHVGQVDRPLRPSASTVAAARRLAAVAKFREKRKHRSFAKKVRYESRKKLAEQRPRVRGQFVKMELVEARSRADANKTGGRRV